ncbi:Na+/H+ antiporter [Microcystis aeruginosa NIES-3806]|uniref:Na+/H+ antiporter n=2 Tax=Microcystis aeruginosa TaxID=1126 RepID=A0A0F6U128_MICAE|nr:sodium:proton antiporter [Microcystis aeruginosa]AKE62504.1 Na+/H+ antiporter [Microcystis aeruginosa NIES-2549]AOC50894.1 Na+/H+ antiporter [Microcystis aeruginosa NIES-2481]GCL44819.1 Na+/H+ antiporter [Microcystis aeruginosa NIES-3787]GCL56428.1 Na+/H+ antiporter [Microcystis aeruginosa NIES-3806]
MRGELLVAWAAQQKSLDSSSAVNSQTVGDIPELVLILILLLLIATAVALITQRLRISYVAGLVLAGLPITDLLSRRIGLDPFLVLNLFLPILIFEAAINTDISRLRSTFKPIALLAGPGSVFSAAIIAVLVKFGLGLDWIPALLVGVILANTDTVSMIAVFKEIRVPSRLSTIVEGETLFNDAAALVTFNLLLVIYATGTISTTQVIKEVLIVALGGGLVGAVLGYLCLPIYVRLRDPLSSLLLTVALALGAFQLGQFLGVSGAVAVVIAGLVFGNLGLPRSASASDRITLISFWEYAGFIVNTFIFLLIGIEINPLTLWQTLPSIVLVILAYQLGRILSVYSLLWVLRRIDRPIPLRWQHILILGNIKGSLSMALAVAIPLTLTGRELIIELVFGAVLFSLVIQGLALPWLIKKLDISQVSAVTREIGQLQLQLIASKAAQDELANLLKSGVLPKAVYEELWASYQAKVAVSERVLRDAYNQSRSGQMEPKYGQLDAIRRRLFLAEKAALGDALRKRIVPEDLVQSYVKGLDEKLLSLDDD